MRRKYTISDRVILQLKSEVGSLPDTEHNRELYEYLGKRYMSMNPFKRVALEDSDLEIIREKLGRDNGEVCDYHREVRNFLSNALERNQLNIQIGR